MSKTKSHIINNQKLPQKIPEPIFNSMMDIKIRNRKFEEFRQLNEPTTNNLLYKEMRRSIRPSL